jgi:histidine phosphotransferase ChpT
VDTREARTAIEGLFGETGKVTIGWMIEEGALPKPAVKVLLNLALIAGDALVRGGQLDIGAEENAGKVEIVVRAEGPRLVLDPELRATLLGELGEDGVTPRGAAAYLVHSLVAAGNGTVQISEPDSPILLFGVTIHGE